MVALLVTVLHLLFLVTKIKTYLQDVSSSKQQSQNIKQNEKSNTLWYNLETFYIRSLYVQPCSGSIFHYFGTWRALHTGLQNSKVSLILPFLVPGNPLLVSAMFFIRSISLLGIFQRAQVSETNNA